MYEIDEREGQVDVIVEDVDQQALFTEVLLGLTDVLTDAVGGEPMTHEVLVGPAEPLELLTYWVEEVIGLTEERGFVPERIEKERLESATFSARLAGVRGLPAGDIRRLLLHDVELKRLDDGAWAARVILDIDDED